MSWRKAHLFPASTSISDIAAQHALTTPGAQTVNATPRESELVMNWKTILGIGVLGTHAVRWFMKKKESAMGDPQKPEQKPGQPGTPQQPQPRPGQPQPRPGRQDESEEEEKRRQPGQQEPGGQQR